MFVNLLSPRQKVKTGIGIPIKNTDLTTRRRFNIAVTLASKSSAILHKNTFIILCLD
jgi:hypothetical protein